MKKQKHMDIEARIIIETELANRSSFKQIASVVGKDCTTISKEVRNHRVMEQTGSYGKSFNDCAQAFYRQCDLRCVCERCTTKKRLCWSCGQCTQNCVLYKKMDCRKLLKPPYVCNACPERRQCTLEKAFYRASIAQGEYQTLRSESRSGFAISEEELKNLDDVISPLIINGHSLHHICLNHADEGIKGGAVLLTIHFVQPTLQLAFLRKANDSQSVIDIFERLYIELRPDIFIDIFPLLLADNGSEFSNPRAIEFDRQENRITRMYYCNPNAPYEKPNCENNHEMIRRIIPKGVDIGQYTQAQISLMMSHINSYARKSLGDKSPYEVFAFQYGRDILTTLGLSKIPPNEIILSPKLFTKSNNKSPELEYHG